MDIIFWRHADAVDGIPDLSRQLTPKGLRQAEKVAAWLTARIPDETRILVSPAARTRQTAEALGRPFSIEPALAPDRDAMSLLLAADWPHAGDSVLLVGHQPTLGRAAMLLLTGHEAELTVRKAGLVWISNRVRDGSQQNVLRAAISPDLA